MDNARAYILRMGTAATVKIPAVTWVRPDVEVLAEPLPDGQYKFTVHAPNNSNLNGVTIDGGAREHASAIAFCGGVQ